jgi:hypothetical protein
MENKKILTCLLVLLCGSIWAQTPESKPDMAEQFFADGKIYVVVTIAGMLIVGLFIYLFLIDRKINRLEKQSKEKN